ncbi:hypothetical protein PUN28_013156 [Cardiocondyla obscurior]|uniref:Uncharacterized protein n=1 Tax=Cardiocondyla obscurior TaxID=286306 RepID=A0AAW2F8I9_9HYME
MCIEYSRVFKFPFFQIFFSQVYLDLFYAIVETGRRKVLEQARSDQKERKKNKRERKKKYRASKLCIRGSLFLSWRLNARPCNRVRNSFSTAHKGLSAFDIIVFIARTVACRNVPSARRTLASYRSAIQSG